MTDTLTNAMSTSTATEKDTIHLEISLEISKTHKTMLEKAAMMKGLPLNEYLIQVALDAARATNLDSDSIALSDRDWDSVTSAIENPPELHPRLTAALQRYKEKYKQP